MSPHLTKTRGKKIAAHWDELDFLGRLKLIIQNQDLFFALRLVTLSELKVAESMSPTEWEYILNREDQPIFTSVDLHETVKNQYYHEKLIAALKAVFC